MPRDIQPKMSKKEMNKSKRREEEARKKKKNIESSDDDNSSYYSDDDNEEDEMDVHEYRKFLKKMFPSKHLDKKIKAGEKLKKIIDEEDDDDEEDEEEEKTKKQKKNNTNAKKKKSHKKIVESEDEDEEDYEDDEAECSDEEDDDYDEDEDDDNKISKGGKFNIIFTIGGKEEDDDEFDEEDEDEWETESEYDTENEDDPISSDEEDEEDEDEDECEEDDECEKIVKKKNSCKICKKDIVKKSNSKEKSTNDKNTNDKNTNDKNTNDKNVTADNQSCSEDTNAILVKLRELQSLNPNDKSINKCIKLYETEVKSQQEKQERKTKKEKDRNSRIFKRILRDKNTMNDFEFYEKLELGQQKKIIKELREINKVTRIEKPYRLTLLESDIPVIFKAAAMKKISSLRYMEPGSGEYYKIKNWVDTFMRIPFGKYETLPLSITDGVDKCHDFMAEAQKTLDNAVYGLNDAKMQIMQMLGQLITNPKAIGSAIAIHGPPGTGKTSLVREGISKILNRPFAFIALGGATDSSFLEGHGYTYEGSTWGKIVQILIDSKCMNPVIYFDELDKISDTPKGEEIAGILTHLTDTSQNTQFHDKYFAEIDFDLSKCLFIFSYNDESKVNHILKDRMYRIQTKGYDQKQKTVISNNYLLPKIREQVKFVENDIIIPNQTLEHIIENYCNKEDGVRNLKRCLEIIHTKLNLYRLMRPGSNLFGEDMALKVEFPFTVTKDVVNKLIKQNENSLNPAHYGLYV